MRTVVIANQKGGAGKTSTAIALACGLKNRGYNVLAVDLDSQRNLSKTFRADFNDWNIFDVLTDECNINDAVQHDLNTPSGSSLPDLVPSSKFMANIDSKLDPVKKNYLLRISLKDVSEKYDFCILDTPPALSTASISGMVAADYIILPAQADMYNLDGIQEAFKSYQSVKEYFNSGLKLAGVLMTRYSGRAIISKNMSDDALEIASAMGTFLYASKIREAVAVKEAQALCEDLYQYAPKSNAAIDYNAFVDEFLEKVVAK